MSETTKATIAALVVVIVNVAAMLGYSLDSDMLTQVISAVVLIIVTVLGCWKNFNFTAAAQAGQLVTDSLKAAVADGDAADVASMPSGEATDGELPDQTAEADTDAEG